MLIRAPAALMALGLAIVLSPGCAARRSERVQPAIDPTKVVDLSYSFGPDTIYWPTAESFTLTAVAHGRTPQGYWYAANNLCMAEHGGTHMDAPIHFAENGRSSDAVPLAAGIGPVAVVDVRAQAAADRDYRLTASDIEAWEQRHGRLPHGAIVIMRSGWGRFWPDKLHYLGTDKKGDTAHLHFPGF